MFKPEYSIQSLLNMNIEENVYQRCIAEAKSPLQTFNLSHSTIDSGSKIFNTNNQLNSYEPEYETISQLQQPNRFQLSKKRSMSRPRKRIFDQAPKTKNQIMSNGSGVDGCWFGCMDYLLQSPRNQPRVFQEIKTTRSQHLTIKQYSPLENHFKKEEIQTLYYQNSNIPTYEVQFIQFLLKIIPKLYLRNQLSTHLFVNKAQLLQSLMSQLYKQQKSQGINNLFMSGKLQRLDRRFKSSNLNQFVSKLTLTSNKPVNSYAQDQVVSTVQKIISTLNQVQQDIRQYLLSDRRVQQLQLIYYQMTHANVQQKNLCLLLYQYLNSKGVGCKQSNIQYLQYIWSNLKYKPYTRQQFIQQLVKNDLILKHSTPNNNQLQRQLQRLGYSRNN